MLHPNMNSSETTTARILIVDDEAAQMKALSTTLREEGYETTAFTNADEALDALQEGQFDLILTDLMMPQMDGIEVLSKAFEKDPNLMGVVMTGHGTIDTAVAAMKAGAFDYVLKPFQLKTMLPILKRALVVRDLRMENAALQKRVEERTQEIERANQELEVANRELDAFAQSISHDLRAPLRGMAGYSQQIIDEYSAIIPKKGMALLEWITESAAQTGRLVDDLLIFCKYTRQPVERQPVNVSVIVRQVLEDMSEEREGRDVEIRMGALPDCIGDPSLLRQVWFNLLSNAHKFTRKREHAIIEIGCQEQPTELVYFVQDNGAGFDMQHAAHLFGVFKRLHHQEEFDGTGVGLSLTDRIIRRHGGRIWAEAAVDKGATFYFTLPRSAKG
jgi:signal transduction histidine kinase